MFIKGMHMKNIKKHRNLALAIADEAAVIKEMIEVAKLIESTWKAMALGSYATDTTGRLIAAYGVESDEGATDLGMPEDLPDFVTLNFETLAGRYANIWSTHAAIPDSEDRWRRSHCVFVMRVLWNYAVNALWHNNIGPDEMFINAAVFCGFGQSTGEGMGGKTLGLCRHVFDIAYARAKLDDGLSNGQFLPYRGYERFLMMDREGEDGTLTLHDMALLAQMTEKSVRNATFMDGENRLNVYGPQGSFRVKPEEALRWLNLRRGFRPTTFIGRG